MPSGAERTNDLHDPAGATAVRLVFTSDGASLMKMVIFTASVLLAAAPGLAMAQTGATTGAGPGAASGATNGAGGGAMGQPKAMNGTSGGVGLNGGTSAAGMNSSGIGTGPGGMGAMGHGTNGAGGVGAGPGGAGEGIGGAAAGGAGGAAQ